MVSGRLFSKLIPTGMSDAIVNEIHQIEDELNTKIFHNATILNLLSRDLDHLKKLFFTAYPKVAASLKYANDDNTENAINQLDPGMIAGVVKLMDKLYQSLEASEVFKQFKQKILAYLKDKMMSDATTPKSAKNKSEKIKDPHWEKFWHRPDEEVRKEQKITQKIENELRQSISGALFLNIQQRLINDAIINALEIDEKIKLTHFSRVLNKISNQPEKYSQQPDKKIRLTKGSSPEQRAHEKPDSNDRIKHNLYASNKAKKTPHSPDQLRKDISKKKT